MERSVDFLTEIFPDAFGHREEDFDDLGIELASGPNLDFFLRDREGSSSAIRAIGTDRVERVGDGEDTRTQWNLLAFQAARIPGAIKFLLVGVDNLGVLKVEMAAKRIYEINPYATVELFPEGLLGNY